MLIKIFNINPCPLYNQLKDNVFKSKEFLDLNIKNEVIVKIGPLIINFFHKFFLPQIKNIIKQINDGIGGGNLTLAEFENLADSLYIQVCSHH